METAKTDTWSVKSPAQLNLILDKKKESLRQENIAAGERQRSPLQISPSPFERNKIKTQATGRRKINSRQATNKRASRSQVATQLKSQEAIVRLPQFGNSKQLNSVVGSTKSRDRWVQQQKLQGGATTNEVINNSHIPSKALNYLQLVDEPNVKKVVSKFNSHEYQCQFKNPLPPKTLFLSNVQQVRWDYQTTATVPAICSPQEVDAVHRILPKERDNLEEPRVFNTRNRRRSEFFTCTGDAADSVLNPNRRAGSCSSAFRHIQGRKMSNTANRNTRNMMQTYNLTSAGFSMTKASNNIFIDKSKRTKRQDSIESILAYPSTTENAGQDQNDSPSLCEVLPPSSLGPGSKQVIKDLDPAKRQLVKDFVFYRISQQTYQPVYRESREDQLQRKRDIMLLSKCDAETKAANVQTQVQMQQHLNNSLYSQPSVVQSITENNQNISRHRKLSQLPNSANTNTSKAETTSSNVVSTVISSALRVRDIDTLQGRKASHQVENGGMMYIKDEYQNQLQQRMSNRRHGSLSITPTSVFNQSIKAAQEFQQDVPIKSVNQQEQMKFQEHANQLKFRIESINEEKDQSSEAIIQVENPKDVHVDMASNLEANVAGAEMLLQREDTTQTQGINTQCPSKDEDMLSCSLSPQGELIITTKVSSNPDSNQKQNQDYTDKNVQEADLNKSVQCEQQSSLKPSLSASNGEPSALKIMPLESKIQDDCGTPATGGITRVRRRSLNNENESDQFIVNETDQIAGKAQQSKKVWSPLQMKESGKHGLIDSGSMTMKIQRGTANTGPDGSNSPSQNGCQESEGRLLGDTLKLQLSHNLANKAALNTSEELSMKNLVKINSQGTQEKDETNNTRESNADTSSVQNQNQEATLQVIDPLSAQVEVVKECSTQNIMMGHRQSYNDFTHQGSMSEYEEFRQAGIISKKYSSNMGATEGKGSINSLAHQINRDSILAQPRFAGDQMAGKKNGKQGSVYKQQRNHEGEKMHRVNIRTQRPGQQQRIRDKLLKIQKGEIHNQHLTEEEYYELMLREEVEYQQLPQKLQNKAEGDYIITNYSLPKALVAQQKSAPNQPGSNLQRHTRSVSQKRGAQAQAFAPVAGTSPINQTANADIQNTNSQQIDKEQFNYERKNKNILTGPQGRKFSQNMAQRIVYARNKRNSEGKYLSSFDQKYHSNTPFNKTAPNSRFNRAEVGETWQNQSKFQSTQKSRQEKSIESSFENQLNFECQGGSVAIQLSRREAIEKGKQRHDQSTSIQKGGNQIVNNQTPEDSVALQDLSDVLYPGEGCSTEGPPNATMETDYKKSDKFTSKNKRQKVVIPQLALKKVELMFQADNNYEQQQSGTRQFTMNSNYFQVNMGRSFPISNSNRQRHPNESTQQTSTERQTRMISIDVQTDQNKGIKKRNVSKRISSSKPQKAVDPLKIIQQEKSVQDTLYDGGDLLQSQPWLRSGEQLAHVDKNGYAVMPRADSSQRQTTLEDNKVPTQPTPNSCLNDEYQKASTMMAKKDQSARANQGSNTDRDVANSAGANKKSMTVESQQFVMTKNESTVIPGCDQLQTSSIVSTKGLPTPPTPGLLKSTDQDEMANLKLQRENSQHTDADKYQQTFRDTSTNLQNAAAVISSKNSALQDIIHETPRVPTRDEPKTPSTGSQISPLRMKQLENKYENLASSGEQPRILKPKGEAMPFNANKAPKQGGKKASKAAGGALQAQVLPGSKEINILVKKIPKKFAQDLPQNAQDIGQHGQDQFKKQRVTTVDGSSEMVDEQFLLDRYQIMSSNKDVNLEAIMRLRYSSDEVPETTLNSESKNLAQGQVLHSGYGTVTIESNSMNASDYKNNVKRVVVGRGDNQNSFDSSEYLASQIKEENESSDKKVVQLDKANGPSDNDIKKDDSSKLETENDQSELIIPVEKSKIYQMRPIFPESEQRNQFQRENSGESRSSHNMQMAHHNQDQRDNLCYGEGLDAYVIQGYTGLHEEDSICEQKYSRANNYGNGGRDNRTPSPNIKVKDHQWLERFCRQEMNNQQQMQEKRVVAMARRERRLTALNSTKHTSKKVPARDRTPPISENFMLKVPQKRHSRAKVGKIGNELTQVESVWAKTKLGNAPMNLATNNDQSNRQ